MSGVEVPHALAFLLGILSIISPCVIVLLPVYLATITGVSISELRSATDARLMRRRLMGNAFGFVLGFFLIFIPLGALIGLATQAIGSARSVVGVVAGLIILFLGVNFIIPLPFMRWTNIDLRIRWQPKAYTFINNLFFGAVIAFVWTPCVGPFLLSVVALVGVSGNMLLGAGYFAAYSGGLAVSIITFTFFYSKLAGATKFIQRYHRAIAVIAGSLLIIVAILMLTNQLYLTNALINKLFNDFQPETLLIN